MSERIERLIREMNQHDLIPKSVPVTYDPLDQALPEAIFNAKRITEYIAAQTVYLTEENRFTGMLRFEKACVPSDIFHRSYHEHLRTAMKDFYCRYPENLVTLEWQHASPNYERIISTGMEAVFRDIEYYKNTYRFDEEKYRFLEAEEIACRSIIAWSEKCALATEQAAENCEDPLRKAELMKLAEAAHRVPMYPARSFYEGLQCLIFCFQFLPDSIGTMDRFLYRLYRQDIDAGVITRDEAKDLIQEVFVHICNHTPVGNMHAGKTAECHFAIGGYNEKGEDGFTDLSRLITEALMDMDTRRPAISLRWTAKTPYETLKFMLDAERHDKNKRIAFVNDEPRLKAFTEIIGLPWSDAIRYTMVGCNEPAFPGAVWYGGCTTNIVRSLEKTLTEHKTEVLACPDFDSFFALYKTVLTQEIDRILWYADKFNDIRAKDINVLSNFLLDGPIENGRSATQFSCKNKLGGFNVMGSTCLMDSLAVIRQFVYEEKRVTMAHLLETLESNWAKDPALRTEILKSARFFGNGDTLADDIARKVTTALWELTKDRRMKNGAHILIGTLNGYNPHNAAFGKGTMATPDGRFAGDTFMIGTGQAQGKDRKGMIPLLRSVAQMDPHHIFCGPVVCNLMVEESVIRDDEKFDKFCRVIEQYFRMGGLHVQLNYLSKEELAAARKTPEDYPSLKVRVSGYSADYVTLPTETQDEIYQRTLQHE